jgi:predicted fused transcriptional regulator/phosphomethylpyrimidine kinase
MTQIRNIIMNHDTVTDQSSEPCINDAECVSLQTRLDNARQQLDARRSSDPDFKAISHIGKMLFQMLEAMQKERAAERRG